MARKLITPLKKYDYSFDPERDWMRTVQDGAITPSQIKELAERGIPVSPQAVEREIHGRGDWNIEPMFKRDMDAATAWELEQRAKADLKSRIRKDKDLKFVTKIKNAKQTSM